MNNGLISILIGSTRARIRIPQNHPFFMYLRDVLKRTLSAYDFDPRLHRWNISYRYYYYNKARSELVIPITTLKLVTDELDANAVPYEIKNEELVTPRKIETKMNPDFKLRDDQKEYVDLIAKEDPLRVPIAAQTGFGKTVVAIASIIQRGEAAMIVVSGLMQQWVDSFRKFTNIQDRICVIQGVHSLMALMEAEERPDVIVFSLETLRLYVQRAPNYEDLPSYEQFIKYFGIGIKFFDETHRAVATLTRIDLGSNIQKNVYLSATYTQGGSQERRIFNMIFPKESVFGSGKRDRYIKVWSYGYRIYVPEKVYQKLRGYSHVKYEAYFFKRPSKLKHFFDTALIPVINAHYHNKCQPGQRCLIFFATIDMIMAAKQYLEKEYPTRKVGVYIGESKEGAYNDYEIIISNHKKAGTGTDIKNLYVVINTVSFSTPTLTEQSLGRLRKLPNGDTPEYIDLVNLTCGTHLSHRANRKQIQENLALEYTETALP